MYGRFLGLYPDKTIVQKDTRTPVFIAALFTIAKTWKQPKCPPIDEWLKKMRYTHTTEYLLSYEKRNLPTCDNMDKSRRYAK